MKVTKKNGTISLFDDDKIATGILKANAEVPLEELTKKEAYSIADEVFNRLTSEKEIISTADVRTCVHAILLERNLTVTAQHYMDYNKG